MKKYLLIFTFLLLVPQAAFATTIYLTSGTSWTVPADWNNSNNTIEVIGGGGGGGACAGGGGGGGAYSKVSTLSLTPGGTVTYKIGSGGSGGSGSPSCNDGALGSDTVFNGTGASCSGAQTSEVCGKGGGGGIVNSSGGPGGASGNGVGTTKYSGGGGSSSRAGGGGGAAGPNGAGNTASTGNGGSGDNGFGGAGGAASPTVKPPPPAGVGGNGTEWDSTHGSGGGGGGGGDLVAGATGGLYGAGGGGGSAKKNPGGNGKQGLIVITYTPATSCPPPTVITSGTTKTIFITCGTSWSVPSDWNNSNNTIEVIGGGGGGGNGNDGSSGGGGGGGGYSKVSNIALTPGPVSLRVGSGGAISVSGGNTFFCDATSGCNQIQSGHVVVGAKGGTRGGSAQSAVSAGAGGVGGSAASGVGGVKYSGGSGGAGWVPSQDDCTGGAGGGGAAGLHGAGLAGEDGDNTSCGYPGGTFYGKGGVGDSGFGGAGGVDGGNGDGGVGGNGAEWDASHGSGGGGGGGGYQPVPFGVATRSGGVGGAYGGGGGGGASGFGWGTDGSGASGKQGIIVITYTTVVAPTCSVTLNPKTIAYGGTGSTLSYSSANVPASNYFQINTVGPVTSNVSRSTTVYAAGNYDGFIKDNTGATVAACSPQGGTLTVTPPPLPTATITTNDSSIKIGESATITATFSAGTGDTLTNDNIDMPLGTALPSSGTLSSKTYTFTPTSAGTYTFFARAQTEYWTAWRTLDTIQVTVTPPAPQCTDFHFTPPSIGKGQSSTLFWDSTNATDASVNHGVGPISVPSGSKPNIKPVPSRTTTYTGTFEGSVSPDATCSATLTVCTLPPGYSCLDLHTIRHTFADCHIEDKACPASESKYCSAGIPDCLVEAPSVIDSLRAVPNIVRQGDPTKLFWEVTNVSECTIEGSDGQRFSPLSGSNEAGGLQTRDINQQTIFTLTCTGLDNSSISGGSAVVNIVPVFQEQ
ncbi:MAG: hypothetical protein Q7R90_01750 [bacterium]|nr:hypothetical protein [bacterium]